MDFVITALPRAEFEPFFAMSDAELAANLAQRLSATDQPGFPCRVSLADAEIGEEVLLINYRHQPAQSPFQATHAVFVRRNAVQARPRPGEIPKFLCTRTLSLRGFDAAGMMLDAALAHGTELAAGLAALLENPAVADIHIHNAKQGCYLARAARS